MTTPLPAIWRVGPLTAAPADRPAPGGFGGASLRFLTRGGWILELDGLRGWAEGGGEARAGASVTRAFLLAGAERDEGPEEEEAEELVADAVVALAWGALRLGAMLKVDRS